jgi:hypothetical protein
MRNVHPEVFRLFNDVNTKSKDKKTINDLLFWRKKIPQENKAILEKIINQFNDIHEALQPLADVGVTFDLWLVGGSVRDLVLGNGHLIKDLDIMLSLHQPVVPKVPTPKFFMKKTKLDFTKPELQPLIYRDGSTVAFSHWDILESKEKSGPIEQQKRRVRKTAFFDMISCALAQKLTITESYKPSLEALKQEPLTEKYVDGRLNGVIKINKDNWTWPVDILITENSVDAFLSAFDFGICKVGIELLRGQDVREQRKILPHTPINLMKRARITRHFLEDFQAKQHSMIVSESMTLKQVQHSCENHLERLEKKYPWVVKIDIESSPFNSIPATDGSVDVKEEYLKSFFLKRKLERTLDVKVETKKVVKKI